MMTGANGRAIAFTVRGPIALTDLPGLCVRVCRQLQSAEAGPPTSSELSAIYCDVAGVTADAMAIEALARLQLAARQRGCQVRLRNAPRELLDLVALVGLADVLPDVSDEP